MSDDLLKSKIELLQAQIDNLEKSGFFTEKEINQKSISLKAQLSLLENIQSLRNFAKVANFTADNLMKCFEAFENMNKPEILTPNHQEA